MAAVEKRFISPEQYIERERLADCRSEYYNGEIFAMAGASESHDLIAGNLYSFLRPRLRKQNCRVYSSDMKVLVSENGLYTYPDLSISCGEPEFVDEKRDVLLNPRIIFEVLSDSTESYDRKGKFDLYGDRKSLLEYFLISQSELRVEHFTRQPESMWSFSVLHDRRDKLVLHSDEVVMSVAKIYQDITFPERGKSSLRGNRRPGR